MKLKEFIKKHREEIDFISKSYKTDEERELWVMNDEALYIWAKSEGVEI